MCCQTDSSRNSSRMVLCVRCARVVELGPATVYYFAASTALNVEKHPTVGKKPVRIHAAGRNNCSWLVDTRFTRYVREKPFPCINIRRALLDSCCGLGLCRVDCA